MSRSLHNSKNKSNNVRLKSEMKTNKGLRLRSATNGRVYFLCHLQVQARENKHERGEYIVHCCVTYKEYK